MGYNTTVLIVNDALDHIEHDPDFGKKLAEAVRQIWHDKTPGGVAVSARRDRSTHSNAASVIETHHADQTAVVLVGGNTARSIGLVHQWRFQNPDDQIAILDEVRNQIAILDEVRSRIQPSMTCFVFGSNLAGRHGAGAALHARKHYGAVYGIGIGPSLPGEFGISYGIPTKNYVLKTLPLNAIHAEVIRFISFAEERRELLFKVTRIGCGLAGYANGDIAPMFAGAPSNCEFDPQWAPYGLKSWTEPPQ